MRWKWQATSFQCTTGKRLAKRYLTKASPNYWLHDFAFSVRQSKAQYKYFEVLVHHLRGLGDYLCSLVPIFCVNNKKNSHIATKVLLVPWLHTSWTRFEIWSNSSLVLEYQLLVLHSVSIQYSEYYSTYQVLQHWSNWDFAVQYSSTWTLLQYKSYYTRDWID